MTYIALNFWSPLFRNLEKAAEKKLVATGAAHVIFGVTRNARGQLSTFFKICMTHEDLYAFEDAHEDGSYCFVHA